MKAENRIPQSKRFQYGLYHTLDHFIGSKAGKALTVNSRRRFYRNLHAYLKEKGEGQLLPLERRKDLSLKEFKQKYLRHGIPVILEGAAKEWPCVKNRVSTISRNFMETIRLLWQISCTLRTLTRK